MSRKSKQPKKTGSGKGMDRRSFMGTLATAAGTGAVLGASSFAPSAHAETVHFPTASYLGGAGPFRSECDIQDCDVEGEIPASINGAFYRVGPDWQYPPMTGNIPFDGEGHVSMFRIANGHVDFKSRYARTQRFKAQAAARKRLFGMYRNHFTDDPSVAQVSRGTANTHVVFHHGHLFALKEDSPPVAMNPLTLETVDDYYTYHGELKSLTHTAHPKFDYTTGEMISFGYEAKGFATDDVCVFSADAKGHITWQAWIKAPYVGMVHDFAVSQKYVAFLVIPMATNVERMKQGQVHYAWDSTLPTWFGVMERGGDGKDVRWFKGPERCATHVMGAFSDGNKMYVDMDMALKNQFPFFPNLHGEPFDPKSAVGYVTRLSVDLSKKDISEYSMERLYPQAGVLPRQDDRYQTLPYRIGFMPTTDPTKPLNPKLGNLAFRPTNSYTRFDHATRATSEFFIGDDSSLQECCFIPRSKNAPEGDGYLVGVANRLLEGGRSDLVIVDALHMEDGPVATVRLPYRIYSQVHGWWVPGDALPKA
ncbi:MAG: carotenoid oxygenase family protein [Acidobacteriia bacterium]|nr:carotenoid oxygenase family protein [Terriglobia bacterium]